MSGTLSVTLLDCFMNKTEKDVAISLKPKFCRYVDDTYKIRSKNQLDELFERMNKYHPNKNLTVEVNASNFLDTKNYRDNNEIKYFAYHKKNEITIPLDIRYTKTLQEECYYWRLTSR